MKEIQRIEVTGKNINDIFSLPCVYCIDKKGNGLTVWCNPLMMIGRHPKRGSGMFMLARIGDSLVEYDNGKWEVIRRKK